MRNRFKIKVFKCSVCGRVVLHDCAGSRVARCLCGVAFNLVTVKGGGSSSKAAEGSGREPASRLSRG